MLYPYVEERITGDRRDHDLLDRPRTAPTRTGVGVAGLIFVAVLWAAGGADIIATTFSVSIEYVILTLQAALVIGPVVGFSVARRIALGLQKKDRMLLEHGYETGRILRLPGGEYVEVHRPLDPEERERIALPHHPDEGRLAPAAAGHDVLVGVGNGEAGSATGGD